MSNKQNRRPIYGSGGVTTMVWNKGTKSYDVIAPGSGYTAIPIVPLNRPETEESNPVTDLDQSTWRTRPGLF